MGDFYEIIWEIVRDNMGDCARSLGSSHEITLLLSFTSAESADSNALTNHTVIEVITYSRSS